ncbi:MAG TPA: GNAT family N-acetyltransferase [Nocardioides sp.]|nr:GNAT family N-acetyltransferase [Nocardioides sp.]
MPPLPAERVHAASAAWVWIPALAPRAETEEFLVVRYPPWWEFRLQVVALQPRRRLPEVLDDLLADARGLADGDVAQVLCPVPLGAPEGLEEELVARGGRLTETLDVLALDLAGHVPSALAPTAEVELRWSVDLAVFLDAAQLMTDVFGGSIPDREALEAEHPGEVAKVRDGGGGTVVAYLDGRPVGAAGLTVEGLDARLWSGAVVPAARGRGFYRALLAARLQYAQDAGAEIAIVKGRVETSGPILRRAGFTAYGQERSYLLDL